MICVLNIDKAHSKIPKNFHKTRIYSKRNLNNKLFSNNYVKCKYKSTILLVNS